MLKFVVGLFESKGIAEDAVNRLKYEGIPPANVSLLLMHGTTAGVPAVVTPELAALDRRRPCRQARARAAARPSTHLLDTAN